MRADACIASAWAAAMLSCGGASSHALSRAAGDFGECEGPAYSDAKTPSAVPVTLRFHNRMNPSAFQLWKACPRLDGANLFSGPRRGDSLRALADTLPVTWSGPVEASGTHTLLMRVVFRGVGDYRNFDFDVRSSRKFEVRPGLVIDVIYYEQGNAKTPIEDRPAMKFEERIE